jgi:uncharacterized protein YbjT (DUF2867 family)
MSETSIKTILVTGATGQQGGATARHLLAGGHTVRAMTRKLESPAAKALEEQGAELVQASFDDAAGIERAARGAYAVFAMSTPYEAGAEEEIRQGVALLDSAKQAGVKHIVFTSVGSADRNTGIPHFDSKYEVEKHLAGLGIPYTILGPVWFMENALSPWYAPELKQGRLPMPMPADRPNQQIAIDNIGAVGAAVIDGGDRFHGKRIDLAGDDLTGTRMAEVISEMAGKEISYIELPLDEFRKQNEDWGKMFEWFTRVGYSVDIEGLKRDFPEVGWLPFEDWAKKQDWAAIRD